MKKLTVVQTLPALNAGGVERGTLEIGRALVAAGQGVVLLPSVVARGLVRPGVVRLTLKAPDFLTIIAAAG